MVDIVVTIASVAGRIQVQTPVGLRLSMVVPPTTFSPYITVRRRLGAVSNSKILREGR